MFLNVRLVSISLANEATYLNYAQQRYFLKVEYNVLKLMFKGMLLLNTRNLEFM